MIDGPKVPTDDGGAACTCALLRDRLGREPPYRVQSFWSPCKRYIATACVSRENIALVDDDGRVWEATGPELAMLGDTVALILHHACRRYIETDVREANDARDSAHAGPCSTESGTPHGEAGDRAGPQVSPRLSSDERHGDYVDCPEGETMTSKDVLLLPCPYCGRSDTLRYVRSSEFHEYCDTPFDSDDYFAVFCDASTDRKLGGCGASAGFARTAEEAAERWNRRLTVETPGEQPYVDDALRHT